MSREDLHELILAFRTEPAFRKLVMDVLRAELLPELQQQQERTGPPTKVPSLFLTYREVQQVLGANAGYVRKLVYRGDLETHGRTVTRESLITWGKQRARSKYRERVTEWCKREALLAERQQQAALQKPKGRERVLGAAETAQIRMAV